MPSINIDAASALAAPSSLISSRWSRDNLITTHPARLYTGRVLSRIDEETLASLVSEWEAKTPGFRLGAAVQGVVSWDVSCESDDGPFVLQVPLTLDEPGKRGRAKSQVPRQNVENLSYFIEQGLGRFAVQPQGLMTLAGKVPAATFSALPGHHPVTFGQGALQINLCEGEEAWLVPLGPGRSADLLAEMVAALVYHYEAETSGGTALADVFVNDGDFAVKLKSDGSFDLRLTSMRQREKGISPELLILYLIQWMAYEDWEVEGRLSGLPVLISNPSVAFEGLARGLAYRSRDLGGTEAEGIAQAREWIRSFSRSRGGRSYRPWAERYLVGNLPLTFGEDLREHWWRLLPMRQRQSVVELSARLSGEKVEAASAEALQIFIERLSREIGRRHELAPGLLAFNDLDRGELAQLLGGVSTPNRSSEALVDDILAHWPYRNWGHLLAKVPGALVLEGLEASLSFGPIVSQDDEGTLESLPPLLREEELAREVANPELFSPLQVDSELFEAAVKSFPTFEEYMDDALHHEQYGYYARSVVIGRGGHFSTHPESFSPHYGKWVSECAFRSWRELLAQGEITEAEEFPVVEFGAGNGRLARDFLDAAAQAARHKKNPQRQLWRSFASNLRYRVYERSASLREKQRELLKTDAVVVEGDARYPQQSLERDFPKGAKAFVLSNEVPDAFGVHKVLFTREGRASAALVVPRVEALLCQRLGAELSQKLTEVDRELRRSFDWQHNEGDLYLNKESYELVMVALSELPTPERMELLTGSLWFEELFVPVRSLPELSAHLARNADQYAHALAKEDSGVVQYLNLHAMGFVRGLGRSLAAGHVLTIDYGDSTWGLVQGARQGDFPFRIYFDGEDYVPRPNDPYALPGTQDLTADVNFTELARAGEEVGLSVIHYGPERDITGLDLPEVLSAKSEGAIAAFLGAPVFKVLLMGSRASELFQLPLMNPLALTTRKEDLSAAAKVKVPGIERELSSLCTALD